MYFPSSEDALSYAQIAGNHSHRKSSPVFSTKKRRGVFFWASGPAARATHPEHLWHDACRLELFVGYNNLPGGTAIRVEYNSELSGFRLSPVQAAFICGCGEGRQGLQGGIGHGGSGWAARAAASESLAKIHPPFLRRKDLAGTINHIHGLPGQNIK